MRSGTKNCYVSVMRAVETTDAATNAPIFTFSLWKNAWAHAETRRGREVAIEGQPVAESYTRFEFDYLDVAGITELDVIDYEGARYSITGLLPDMDTKTWYRVDAVYRPPGTGRA